MSGKALAGLRIGLVTASASRLGGGVFEALVTHTAMLRDLGAEPQVFALSDAQSDADRHRFDPAPVTTCRVVGPRQIGFAPELVGPMLSARLDCVHLHGIWMYPSAAVSRWAGLTGKPYLVSPHGMLDPWITARSRLRKALAKWGYERRSWRRARAFHALTASEAADIERVTGRRDIFVVPNASPAVCGVPPVRSGARQVVYIGRIHAKKNLVALVESWTRARRPDNARLSIAGWGDPRDVARLCKAVAEADGSAEYLGPVFGEAKQALLDRAHFIVLPSRSEGLPMAILEAWANGVPTIMTPECHLPVGFSTGAALECGSGADSIAVSLQQALSMDDGHWQARSQAALACARDHFSPEVVASAWTSIYKAMT